MYNIIRFRRFKNPRIIHRGLTLEQAQAHCQDAQSSSATCVSPKGKRTRTLEKKHAMDPWFDGYRKE